LSLADLGLGVLIPALAVRLLMVGIPTVHFARLFGGRVREGASLIKELEVAGLNAFVRQECLLGFLPYVALMASLFLVDMDAVPLSELSLPLMVLTVLGLMGWVFVDWLRSYSIYTKLEALRKQTDRLRSIAGSALDGLRYVVYLRRSISKTAIKLSKRAILGLARKKAKSESKTSRFGAIAAKVVDNLISVPERIVGKVTDWAKEALDEQLKDRFKGYAERSNREFVFLFLWSLLPAVWLSLIVVMHGA
jgi:hypothetical protein